MTYSQCRLALVIPFLCLWSATQLAAQRCGVERWSIKTGTETDASQIDVTHAKTATIGDALDLADSRH